MALAGIEIEPTGEKDTGICPCCGMTSRTVWGMAQNGGASIAAYYVHWTVGHIPDKGANIDMIVGPWGYETGAEKRSVAALAYRLTDSGPSMMVIDAQNRPFFKSPLLNKILRRDDVVGTAVAKSIFDIADAILMKDKRVAELLGGHEVIAPN